MGRGDNFQTGDQVVAQTTKPRFNGGELLLAQAPTQLAWKTESAMQTADLVDAGFLPPMQIEPALTTAATDAVITLTENMAKLAWNAWNRNRAVESIQQVPHAEWSKAYTAFPELQRHLSEKQATMLMKAIVLNELEHADPKDWGQEQLCYAVPLPDHWTLGFSQLTVKAIRQRQAEFPAQLSKYTGKEMESLRDSRQAPYLVAATLAHYVRQFEKYGYLLNEQTLGYAYNPNLKKPDGSKDIMPSRERLNQSEHSANVMRWFDFLRD